MSSFKFSGPSLLSLVLFLAQLSLAADRIPGDSVRAVKAGASSRFQDGSALAAGLPIAGRGPGVSALFQPGADQRRPDFEEVMALPLATTFSWGDYQGHNWMTSVKYQGVCGACVPFAMAGALEVRRRIAANQYDLPIDLSEQFMLSCWLGTCSAGSFFGLLPKMRDEGCPDESCFPYQNSTTTVPRLCSLRCSDWQSRVFKIDTFGYYNPISPVDKVNILKHEIQYYGPVMVYMDDHPDFTNYTGGVYICNDPNGPSTAHAVVLYGWGTSGSDSCWLGKNSFGTTWGEVGPDGTKGWFRIRMGSNMVTSFGNLSEALCEEQPYWADFLGSNGFQITRTADTADMFYVKQGDLDMDNNPDIVYTGTSSDSLYVVYGKSDGTLEKPKALFKIKKAALAVDYLNQDTLLDIVARTSSQLYILRNLGARQFHVDSIPIPSLRWNPSGVESSLFPSVATGFFDAGATKDILASPATIRFGDGTGAFPTSLTLPFLCDAVASADFNDDGYDDFVATIGDSAKLFLNNGAGVFTQSAAIRIGYHPFDVSTVVSGVDFNHDRNADFAVVTGKSVPGANDTSLITIALGSGTGGILSTDTIQILGSAIMLASNDVNRDHQIDLSIVNAATHSLEMYHGDGSGHFPDSSSSFLGRGNQALLALVTADINRDGNPDYLAGGSTSRIITAVNDTNPQAPVIDSEMVVTASGGVDFTVQNPMNFEISKNFSTVAGSAFWQTDFNHDNQRDERSFDYNLLAGDYALVIHFPPYYVPGNPFTMDIRVDGSQQAKAFLNYSGGEGHAKHISGLNRTSKPDDVGDSIVFYYGIPSSRVTPPNGIKWWFNPPTFSWARLVGSPSLSTRYQFQLDRYHDFRAPIFNDSTRTTRNYIPAVSLSEDSIYYWHFRVSEDGGTTWGPYSHMYAAYIGPPCCTGKTGNVNALGIIDLADLSALVAYLIGDNPDLAICPPAANVNALGIIDLADLSFLVTYLTGGDFPGFPDCPTVHAR